MPPLPVWIESSGRALELIAAKGPSGFTFAEAAPPARVSPAAPHRHFRDREELLANVARRGFEQFEAALKAAWKDGVPNPFSAFERLDRAYLEFARTEPGRHPARSEPGIARCRRARLRGDPVGGRTSGGANPCGAAAAGLHGGAASLFGRGDAGRRQLPMPPEELLEAGVLVYLRGFGFPEGSAVSR
jgi:AcrR family transcriptional regulator